MAFDQTRDMLEHARNFHRKLGVFYKALKESVTHEHTRTLLDHMSRHENHLADRLTQYQDQVSNNLLDTYFQYGSEASPITKISEFEIKPEMDVDDVVATAMHFNECLEQFYHEMAQRTHSNPVREMFENLREMERHEQIELSKQTLELGSIED